MTEDEGYEMRNMAERYEMALDEANDNRIVNIENNIDVKGIIAQLADQAFKKTVVSIAMKLHVDESEVKVRRSQDDFDDLIVIVKGQRVGHITVTFVFNPDTLSNNVVVTFHQHPC